MPAMFSKSGLAFAAVALLTVFTCALVMDLENGRRRSGI
jgi:hypothetical protein